VTHTVVSEGTGNSCVHNTGDLSLANSEGRRCYAMMRALVFQVWPQTLLSCSCKRMCAAWPTTWQAASLACQVAVVLLLAGAGSAAHQLGGVQSSLRLQL
jgi:hypothetical protein